MVSPVCRVEPKRVRSWRCQCQSEAFSVYTITRRRRRWYGVGSSWWVCGRVTRIQALMCDSRMDIQEKPRVTRLRPCSYWLRPYNGARGLCRKVEE